MSPGTATAGPAMGPELAADHGLSRDEWNRILEILGREPTFAELGVFSAMWSEHCSYKSSKPLLRTLPTEGEAVVQGPGENAGVVDVGGGWGLAFKIESHNHPSAVEPYQGAATGSGGILRDVFTMGARPVALFDSLRFGALDSPRSRYLLDGVVRGVGDYGNCVGIPTVGGETVFDPVYERNPLVNVMCLGLVRLDRLTRAGTGAPGNVVLTVGSRTGRDGIHGAAFASEELGEETADSRPQVQVGDPFTEKLLLEATLELIERDLVVGVQDMGAAGLTSSATEMAERAGAGIEIDTARVPVRETGMTPYEILLSESQERMLVVTEPGGEDAVREVLEKWELGSAVIGKVTDDGLFRVRHDGEVVAEIPLTPLVGEPPMVTYEAREDEAVGRLRGRDLTDAAELGSDQEARDALLALLDAPSVASKRWIWEQYDTTVGTNTVVRPGSDAAILRLAGTPRGIAASVDGNGRYVHLSPRRGAAIAVAEAARNVACSGARPLAVTNCLNFGSPRKPAVYHQLREAVAGIGEACRALGTPVTGGNVSLYNETPAGPIHPTPVIGMVGVLDDVTARVPSAFQAPGDEVVLVGTSREELGGSEYLRTVHGLVAGEPPALDLEEAAALVAFLVEAAGRGLLRSAHDVSDGGLAVALTECAILAEGGPVGVETELAGDGVSAAALLFGESQSRAALSCAPGDLEPLLELAGRRGVAAARAGRVGPRGGPIRIAAAGRTAAVDAPEAASVYDRALPRRMEHEAGLTT
ncbi:MAG: phosphoribosylformylglycinamidine synthase subunit PurL [Candidatus Palauibacterales bacterium]|nr:phosphoribosylformylglycinamidine synthase subunit PurL [Candidatus Palauibacterales bacterium]MDP2585174.1 phosphoribosylformylglycinamidine synthase subunit PurL [Candidatus Palauibacterales bacterium]